MIGPEDWARRRDKLLAALGHGVLILPTAQHRLRNGDVHYEFRPGSDFAYLTGFPEPDAVLVAWREKKGKRQVQRSGGLDAYAGCAVIISHDRWFLDRIATHVLAFEGDSQVRWFEGNFSEYETFRKRELGGAAGPHRIKYKPLAR